MNCPPVLDAGVLNHSPSAELMKLVDVDHMNDFDDVVTFLSSNLNAIVHEVHDEFHKLLVDNGKTQLNVPPPPEKNDSHGGLLLKTLSEEQTQLGVTMRREFKVHKVSNGIEIREDIVCGGDWKENCKTIAIQSL